MIPKRQERKQDTNKGQGNKKIKNKIKTTKKDGNEIFKIRIVQRTA